MSFQEKSKQLGAQGCAENCFSETSLISLEALAHDQMHTQEYFIENILRDLLNGKMRNRRRNRAGPFFVHLDNSMCHNARKITEEISDAKLERLPHPAHSPDLSPCDFWLFGMLKEKIKYRAFQMVEESLEAVTLIWNAVPFESLQSVLVNWMELLEWGIANRRGYYIARHLKDLLRLHEGLRLPGVCTPERIRHCAERT
jgi:hypothetical protein